MEFEVGDTICGCGCGCSRRNCPKDSKMITPPNYQHCEHCNEMTDLDHHDCGGNNGNSHPYDFLLRYEQKKRTCKVTLNYHQGGLKKVSEEKEVKI